MIWPKIIAGLWWDIISWEGSLPEIVMPFIKAELCLDTGVAMENISAVFADAKLQTEQNSRKMMGGREWKELRL